jgi:hypothetical protein
MGWIAALKQGAPSSSQVDTMSATGNADMTKPVTVVTGTATVTLTKPVDATPGQRKIVLTVSGTTTVAALDAVSGDRDSTGNTWTLTQGGVAEFIWSGSLWYGVQFSHTDAVSVDVNVA